MLLLNMQEMKASVAEVKAQLKELAVQSNATYKQMADAMTKAFSEQTFKEIGERVSKLSPIDMSAALKTETEKARAAIAEYKTVVASALQEVNAEVKNSDTYLERFCTDYRVVRRDAAKEQEANAKQQVAALKYLEAEEKKAAAETKRLEQEKKAARVQATKEWLANNKQQAMAMKELDSSQKEHMGMLQSLGSVMRTVFGLSALTMVLNFFRSYINALKEATEAGYEFVKGVYQLGVGVRALQRAGMDVSFAEVVESLQGLRDEYGIFSTKELVVGAAAFTNLIRDLRLTSEQFFTLQKAVASLAVVNGRSMDEVQRTVALALSSGYTEGLQRLGVSINRVTIAEEAARLGWEGGYTSLTEQQRAFATYNLIIKKTAVYMEELTTYQDTLAGKIDCFYCKTD